MTISNASRTAGPFIGNNASTAFPFTFKVFSAADVMVVHTDDVGEAVLVLDRDYTVDLNADQDNSPGGTVHTLSPLATGNLLTLTSNLAELQPTSLTNQGGFYPKVIEYALDRATILIQQLHNLMRQSLRFPISDGSINSELPIRSLRANKLLGFDHDGRPVAVAPAAQSATALQIALADPNGVTIVGNAVDARALASAAGAGMVGTADGKSVQKRFDSVQEWLDLLKGGTMAVHADQFLGSANPILDAINALPETGGVVVLSNRRYPPVHTNHDVSYIAKANVYLKGAQMPWVSSNMDRLEGGSIIEGKFNVWADNFSISDAGIDCGKHVIDTYFGGDSTHGPNHPDGGTWDAFAFAQPNGVTPLPPTRNFRATNLIGLNRDPQSFGHAVLMEGFTGGVIDNVVGVYGIHALVIKASNVVGGSVAGYGATTNHVIIKSDSYAIGTNIQLDSVNTAFLPPGITAPWTPVLGCSYGLFLHAATYDLSGVKISNMKLTGAVTMLRAGADSAGRNMDNIMFGSVEIDGTGAVAPSGMNFDGTKFNRVRMGRVTIANCTDGIAYQQQGGFSDDGMEIDSLKMENISLRGIQARNFGRLIIGRLRAVNVTNMYAIDDTARVHVGRESLSSVGTKFYLNPPSLTAGWRQLAGQSAFNLSLHNYGLTSEGLLEPTGMLVGAAGADVINLPPYLKPVDAVRMTALGRGTGNVDSARMVRLGNAFGTLSINDGAGMAGAEVFLSLDNLHWRLD